MNGKIRNIPKAQKLFLDFTDMNIHLKDGKIEFYRAPDHSPYSYFRLFTGLARAVLKA
jgi:hypothetical protein